MDKADREKLKQAAQKATQEAITLIAYEHGGGRFYVKRGGDRDLIADFYDEANREFFARANPSAVLSLIEEIERLEEAHQNLYNYELGLSK